MLKVNKTIQILPIYKLNHNIYYFNKKKKLCKIIFVDITDFKNNEKYTKQNKTSIKYKPTL